MPTSALISGQAPAERADVGIGPYGLLNKYFSTFNSERTADKQFLSLHTENKEMEELK